MYQVTKPWLQSRWWSNMNKQLLVRRIQVQLLCVSLCIYRHFIEFWVGVQASATCSVPCVRSGFLIFPFQLAEVPWCCGIWPLSLDVVSAGHWEPFFMLVSSVLLLSLEVMEILWIYCVCRMFFRLSLWVHFPANHTKKLFILVPTPPCGGRSDAAQCISWLVCISCTGLACVVTPGW